KRELLDIILKELVVRKKRRKRGRVTKKEKKDTEADQKVFDEFEKLNRNQSILKLPGGVTQKSKGEQSLFNLFNSRGAAGALTRAAYTLPTTDVNLELRAQMEKKRKEDEKRAEEEKKKSLTRPAITAPSVTASPAPAPIPISSEALKDALSDKVKNKVRVIAKFLIDRSKTNYTEDIKTKGNTVDVVDEILRQYKKDDGVNANRRLAVDLMTNKILGQKIEDIGKIAPSPPIASTTPRAGIIKSISSRLSRRPKSDIDILRDGDGFEGDCSSSWYDGTREKEAKGEEDEQGSC
ncbi:hypothetical protein N9W07_00630, partial [Alphaproteobacteria bacterium]|nr:hypothetical protein [Alphaproteobacteria bacterium]